MCNWRCQRLARAASYPLPVHVAAEPVHQFQPRRGPLRPRVARVRVDPMLEGVHRGDPRKDVHDPFQVRAAGAVGLGRGIELFEELVAQQLHAHRGHFAELDRRAAVGEQILVARGQRVKGMAGFVQDGLHVALQADGVHEDERHPRFGQRGLVAARRFAFAVGQVEQTQVLHPLESGRQVAVEALENLLRARDHLVHLLERAQRRPVQRVHRQVPGPQRLHAKLPLALGLQLAQHGHDLLLHGLVELLAVVRRVIEPAQLAEGVIAVVGETGILRDLLAQLDELARRFPRTSPLPAAAGWRPVPTLPGAAGGRALRGSGPSASASFLRRGTARSASRSASGIAGPAWPPRFPAAHSPRGTTRPGPACRGRRPGSARLGNCARSGWAT